MDTQDTKIEVKVGSYDERGEFLGEIIRFTGEEVGWYQDLTGSTSTDDRGTDYTLYRLPNGNYRVMVENWSQWQSEGSSVSLYLNSAEYDPYEAPDYDPCDSEYGQVIQYTSYSEEEARKLYSQIFAASGMPNVRDLD